MYKFDIWNWSTAICDYIVLLILKMWILNLFSFVRILGKIIYICLPVADDEGFKDDEGFYDDDEGFYVCSIGPWTMMPFERHSRKNS